MKKFTKYQYQLMTKSFLVLSPREQCAMVDDTSNKIVYPFYQYGEYDFNSLESANYYIPGSSIKGAIGSSLLMVDDVLVDKQRIKLKGLNKLQINNNDQAKIKAFFNNIRIEMLESDATLQGELFCAGDLYSILKAANENTKIKLQKWVDQGKEILNAHHDCDQFQAYIENVEQLINEMNDFDEKTCLLLLGGYKGNLLSHKHITKKTEEPLKNAYYLDTLNQLPHGIIMLTF